MYETNFPWWKVKNKIDVILNRFPLEVEVIIYCCCPRFKVSIFFFQASFDWPIRSHGPVVRSSIKDDAFFALLHSAVAHTCRCTIGTHACMHRWDEMICSFHPFLETLRRRTERKIEPAEEKVFLLLQLPHLASFFLLVFMLGKRKMERVEWK